MGLPNRTIGIFVASLVMGTTLPLVTSASLLASTQETFTRAKDGTTFTIRRSVTQKDRKDYSNALRIYNTRVQNKEQGLTKPDVNNRASIDLYLNNPVVDRVVETIVTEPISTSDYVKPTVEKKADDAISVQERAELSRAAKLGKC